jgi:urea transport system substrate-binding protein
MRVGLLLSHSGPCALWRIGLEACAELAVAEINAEGGVRGREIELVRADAGVTPASAAAAAGRLAPQVDAVVGLQPSHQREAVRRGVARRAPYIYTPQWEGGFCGSGVTPLGVTDEEALAPAVRWLAERHGARRFCFVGNDYVWPRVAYRAAASAVRAAGGVITGAQLLPFGIQEYDRALDGVCAARPDAALVVLLGEEAVRFHRAFAEAGLAAIVPRVSLACDETLLWAVGPESAENLFAAQRFFHDGPAGRRERVRDRYAAAFGRTRPPLNEASLGAYDGVRLVAALARTFGDTDGPALAARVGGRIGRSEAMGLLGLSDAPLGRQPVIVAEADGAAFRPRVMT